MKKISLFIASILLLALTYNYYPEPKLARGASVDSLVVYKAENKMAVFERGKLLKTYKVSFGASPTGHKEFEGDEKTPEGIYTINDKNPNSGYHKNLGVSYPNKMDMENARKLGKPAGGDIKIHGLRNGIGFIHKFQRWFNWTNGCIALTNNEVDELYSSVKIGAKINIKP